MRHIYIVKRPELDIGEGEVPAKGSREEVSRRGLQVGSSGNDA